MNRKNHGVERIKTILAAFLASACSEPGRRDGNGFASVSVGANDVGTTSGSSGANDVGTAAESGSEPGTTAQLTTAPDDTGSSTGTGNSTDPATDESSGGVGTGPTPVCGDGVVDGGEACDHGAGNSDEAACTTGCELAVCGDGVIRTNVEACDDGNNIDDDECTNTCTLASCGDGTVQPGEACDDANAVDTDTCLSTCLLASCGDGVVQPAKEKCDDGDLNDNDACLQTCVPAKCGDGAVQVGVEACDDGNMDATDACMSDCVVAYCGDGEVWLGLEECDDENGDDADDCTNNCTVAACGDQSVSGSEECDDGNDDNKDGCTTMCTVPRTCKQILQVLPMSPDGVYVIDPLGPGGKAAFPVYCDMTTAGGGWSLLERSPFGVQAIDKAFFNHLPINETDPAAARHRLSWASMAVLRNESIDLRIDCRGQDYLLTTVDQLFNGQYKPPDCFNWTEVFYKEAQLKGNKVFNKTMCTWNLGASDGCAGAWHIDEHAQNAYGCNLPIYPWNGVAITTTSADVFAMKPVTVDDVNPVHDCHKSGAKRWVMVR